MGDSGIPPRNASSAKRGQFAKKKENADVNNECARFSKCEKLTRANSEQSCEEKRRLLLQHHHELSSLCKDLEQHKIDMQRQHMQLAEALRNLGAPSNHDQASCLPQQQQQQLREKLRTRKEGRDEHGMNGASAFTFPSDSSIGGSSGGDGVCAPTSVASKRDIWDEQLASESLEEALTPEIPELLKFTVYSSGLPTRTIPFRSASFSQVDITSEGKYVRNPRSPITLKPTAFCLMNNSYASGSSTLPRTHGSTVKHHNLSNNCGEAGAEGVEHNSGWNSFGPHGSSPFQHFLQETIDEQENNCDDSGFNMSSDFSQPYQNCVEERSPDKSVIAHDNHVEPTPTKMEMCDQIKGGSSGEGDNISDGLDTGDKVKSEGDNNQFKNSEGMKEEDKQESTNSTSHPTKPHSPQKECCSGKEGLNEMVNCVDKCECSVGSGTGETSLEKREKELLEGITMNRDETKSPPLNPIRAHKPQLVRSPPLIREESIMARSSSEEGPKSDQDDEQVVTETHPISNSPLTLPPSVCSEKSLSKRKMKKQVLLDLEGSGGGTSSISGSGGEDDPDKDKLFRQSSGQSDESAEGDRQSDGCTSPPITDTPHSAGLSLHRSHLSTGNSPLTDALALDSTMRRGSNSAPSAAHASTCSHSATNLHSTSLPQTVSSSGQSYFKNSNENDSGSQSEAERVNSLSSPNVYRQIQPNRRYNKRPLRGPYGEMLEAEMRKLMLPRAHREFDSLDFSHRESKSSSPSRTQGESDSVNSRTAQPPAKLTSSYLMSSMDDLMTKPKHSSSRSRKISANLPVSHYHQGKEGGTPMAFHQRTASSPSQLLYAASSLVSPPSPSDHDPGEQQLNRPQLDSSPRGHVLAEIVETEKSYVDSLRILVKKYMEPLKASDYVDSAIVDEIFFQVPPILNHHEQLLDDLQRTVTDDNQCVGNVFLDTFRQPSLLECYSLFVSNWNNAKASLKMAITSKPQLGRFLEDQARQHKGKLSLDSLLIMPIQRIPRYELLLKELLKHTEPIHEDHSRVILALEKIKKFAIHINCSSVDLNATSREFDFEGWSYGLGHLVRQDIVFINANNSNIKKERALFLFADSLAVASIKRKGTVKKHPQSPNAANSFEGYKFKLLVRIHLTDFHIIKEEDKGGACGGAPSAAVIAYNEELEDLKTLHKMMDLASLLKCPHLALDDMLKELISGLKHIGGDCADVLEAEIREASDPPETMKIAFGTIERKISWLECFKETLAKFARYGFSKLPHVQFIQALPIRKTRAGLQLSCAAPVTLYNKGSKSLEMTDLWVANSDGYVGQICILTLNPEPAITSCNGVCNSRITCIISVPPPSCPYFGVGAYHAESFSGFLNEAQQHSHPNFHSLGYESEDDHHRFKSSTSSSGHKSSSEHWSVWLGTEDGSLHVYDCSDSVRVKKNRHKVQHKSPLHSMIFFDRRVFVALGSGDVAIYSRHPNGKGWQMNDASWITIGSPMNPVTKMVCVGSHIWCACGSQIKVYGENGGMLELIQTIQIVIDGNQIARGVTAMVAGDQQVWIAVQQSSIIKAYSSTTFDCLSEINVTPDVVKILAGCDDIIRQHKSACLRVSALLATPDKTLWIGTSAGVLLTINSSGQNPKISALSHGHTGQVRFLTCCAGKDFFTVISGGDGYEEFKAAPQGQGGPTFSGVATGFVGDVAAGDLSGREDSTNHLLIWKVAKCYVSAL